MAQSQPGPKKPSTGPAYPWQTWIWYAVLMLVTLWVWQEVSKQAVVRTIPYSQFKQYVADSAVVECTVSQDDITGKIQTKAETKPEAKPEAKSEAKPEAQPPAKTATGSARAVEKPAPAQAGKPTPATAGKPAGKTEKTAGPEVFAFRTERVADPDLVKDLDKTHTTYSGSGHNFLTDFLWAWILPIAVILLLWRFFARRIGGMGQSVMSFGASKAKLVADKDTGVTFNDVAGCEEAKQELQEVVSFLKEPGRYRALGAKIPKGVLLVGPPGSGKTLLARAVAGEAHVPFFSISGSEFVEMFVGVGAARVRDLFQQAKAHAPCIVFIDELDAVGRQRSVHTGMVNDEREQTLNQLLVGMDGFEANVGVVVLAATNRPEVLDRALLRPGRFDRQVVVDSPDLQGRLAILKLHAANVPLAGEVDLARVAQETPGFSGADLANVVNEAALLAARRNGRQINQADLQEAVEKVVAGPERKSRRLTPADKRRVAFHEVGHALVAAYCEHAEPLHKISIVPRGRMALGYTLQLPETDRYLASEPELLDKIRGLMGGRAAEEVVFSDITTGAENDLEHATALARQMVCVFGMGKSVGLMHCADMRSSLLEGAFENGRWMRDCSEETAREIDQEVEKLLDEAHTAAKQILVQHRDQLERVANELLVSETMDAETFKHLIGRAPQPAGAVDGAKSGKGDTP